MADDLTLPTSDAGGATIAADNISDVLYPRTKLVIGADGVNDGDVSSANPLPVTGTVTANLGATDNAVLDSIAAAVEGTLTVDTHHVTNAGTFAVQAAQSGTWNVTNITGTVSLPTGAATAAKQPALGTAGLASADVITVQGVASMTPILVNGSGVTQPISGTVTANLSATDNAVLDAIAASVAGTLTVGAHAVTNAGTFVVQENGAALTALQLIDNVIYVDNADWTATSSSHALIGGVYQSTPGTITDGDTGPIRLTANGAVHAAIQNTVTVASHAVTNAGTFATQATLQAGTAYAGKVRLTDGTTDTDIRDLANSNALNVAIVDSSGDQITSFGGGTQYAVDDALGATPTGTVALAIRDDVLSALTPVEGDAVGVRVDGVGALWVSLSATDREYLQGILDGFAEEGNALGSGVLIQGDDGTDRTNVLVDTNGHLQIDVLTSGLPNGAATSAKQDTIVGHLDGVETLLGTIDTNLDAAIGAEGSALGSGVLIQGDDGTDRTNVLVDTSGHLQIDVLTSGLPSGAATAANQTTLIGHVDGLEGLLTTIDADTGGILTAVQTLDNAISGNEMQVDVVAALPAGTNTIGVVINERVSTATVTSVSGSATSVQLLASTAGRKGASFYNDSTAIATIKHGTTASSTSLTLKLLPGGYTELPQPIYTGRIDCIWEAANGAMRITEYT